MDMPAFDIREYIEQRKIPIGVALIVLNFAIGFVSKLPFLELIANPHSLIERPFYYASAVLAYLFSWVLGIVGVFLLGKETYEAIQRKMRKQMMDTYDRHVGRHVEKHIRPQMDRLAAEIERRKKEFSEMRKRHIREKAAKSQAAKNIKK
jgi:zinc transporter ZupT